MESATLLHNLSFGPGFVHLRRGPTRSLPQARQAFRQLMAALGQNVSRAPDGRPVSEAIVQAQHDPTFAGHYQGEAHGAGALVLHADGSGEDERVVRIVGMFCERQAPSGGISTLADPLPLLELLTAADRELLAQDWPRLHPYRDDPPLTHKPILCRREDGLPGFDYGAARLRWGLQRLPDGPDLRHRLALLNWIDRQLQQHVVRLEMAAGDALILHNQRWLHGRSAFRDDPSRPRCIRRIWVGAYLPP